MLRFRVHSILAGTGHTVQVLALLSDPADFTLTEPATLAGRPIYPWTQQPRALDSSGRQQTDLFAFALRDAADASYFTPGQDVELVP